jgi:hypothetical protein
MVIRATYRSPEREQRGTSTLPPPLRFGWVGVSKEEKNQVRKKNVHGVVSELVDVLGRSNDADPVADRMLFEELLREVLEVALGEVDRGRYCQF